MAEHNLTLRQAVWGMPVTVAFALHAARADRLGIDRPGIGDMAAARARAATRAYFEEHYQITP